MVVGVVVVAVAVAVAAAVVVVFSRLSPTSPPPTQSPPSVAQSCQRRHTATANAASPSYLPAIIGDAADVKALLRMTKEFKLRQSPK